jgi:GNAT superfamily N-acetyltransferase
MTCRSSALAIGVPAALLEPSTASVRRMQETIELRDGGRIHVRPLQADDRDALAEGFERLGPRSRYRRFFAPVVRLTDAQLEYLTNVDHHEHEALVAVDERTRDGVGVARFVRLAEGVAEPAVAVADDWQRRGVGTHLLDALSDRARAEGIDVFVAPVLAENAAVLGLLDGLGDVELSRRGEEIEVRIALREHRGAVAALRQLLRHTAAEAISSPASFWHRVSDRRAAS